MSSDSLAGAVSLPADTVSPPFSNIGLTAEPGAETDELWPGIGRTAWYKIETPVDGSVIVDAFHSGSPGEIVLTLHTGPAGATAYTQLSRIGQSYDRPSQYMNSDVVAGQTLYAQVDVRSAVDADYRIAWSYYIDDFQTVDAAMGDAQNVYYGAPWSGSLRVDGPYSGGSFNYDGPADADVTAAVVNNTIVGGGSFALDQAGLTADLAATGTSVFRGDEFLLLEANLGSELPVPDGTIILDSRAYVTFTYHADMPTPAKRNRTTVQQHIQATLMIYDDPTGHTTFPGPTRETLTLAGSPTASWRGNPPSSATAYRSTTVDTDAGSRLGNVLAGRAQLRLGPFWTTSSSSVVPPDWVDRISNVVLHFEYKGFVRVPIDDEPPVEERWIRRPLRMHPRSDALGMSSTRRYGTNPRSIQASLRRGGGTYI